MDEGMDEQTDEQTENLPFYKTPFLFEQLPRNKNTFSLFLEGWLDAKGCLFWLGDGCASSYDCDTPSDVLGNRFKPSVWQL